MYMSSKQLYDSIFKEHIHNIENNEIVTDKYLKTEVIDNRRGVSLIVPISIGNCAYTDLINEYYNIEPDQYFYPQTDLHITVFTYLSARDTYKNNEEINRHFKDISECVLRNIRAFTVLLYGITFSKEAGFINGYDNNILINIRDTIRIEMKKNGLVINERYQ